ncbi:hypothetical protein HWV62_16132 [Athelia sp. TMB]|nr:hypothetical protein HWV62_10571 [Athelia sp. TMB]KAF7984276.1 hypothetical protein HWV62_16132 [Athelia sp. TMB]
MQIHQTIMQSEAPVIAHVQEPAQYHPLFSSPDGDVILGAKGGNLLFRTHSFTLKTASGWFRTMFSLPQNCAPVTSDIIYMDEESSVLEAILRMVCGLPVVLPTTYDMVDALLYAAEKYDMPGPVSIIRMSVMTPSLLNQPLRLYAVACRYGWEEEAKFASGETLVLNLYSEECRPSLQSLSTTALLDLLTLHRDRREVLRKRLDEPPFVGGGNAVCVACGWSICYQTWRELKYKIILEMDVRPLGDTVLNTGLAEWHEAKRCWSAKCPNVDCDRVLYDKNETLRVIKECVDGLKKFI